MGRIVIRGLEVGEKTTGFGIVIVVDGDGGGSFVVWIDSSCSWVKDGDWLH